MWFHQHFNTGTGAGALSRLQARGRVDPERARRAEGLDQPAHRRRPDRLCRRDAGDPHHVRRGARQARADAEDGRRLRGGASPTCRRSCRRARRPEVNVDKDIIERCDRRHAEPGRGHARPGATTSRARRWFGSAGPRSACSCARSRAPTASWCKELFTQPRVYKSQAIWKWKGGPSNYGKKIINPQSAKVAQSIETHIEVYAPGGYGQKHGHMNGAVFYRAQGQGPRRP